MLILKLGKVKKQTAEEDRTALLPQTAYTVLLKRSYGHDIKGKTIHDRKEEG